MKQPARIAQDRFLQTREASRIPPEPTTPAHAAAGRRTRTKTREVLERGRHSRDQPSIKTGQPQVFSTLEVCRSTAFRAPINPEPCRTISSRCVASGEVEGRHSRCTIPFTRDYTDRCSGSGERRRRSRASSPRTRSRALSLCRSDRNQYPSEYARLSGRTTWCLVPTGATRSTWRRVET